jgi:hypothetical protein
VEFIFYCPIISFRYTAVVAATSTPKTTIYNSFIAVLDNSKQGSYRKA